MTDCYVRINQQYQPINMIPVGQIKCSSCNQLFPLNKIDQHCNSHIHPKYLNEMEKNNKRGLSDKPNKMTVNKKFFTDIDDDQQTDIAVRSMMPQELPQFQTQRKNCQINTKPENSLQATSFHPNRLKLQSDSSDLTSHIGNIGFNQNQGQQVIYIQKDIEVQKSSILVNRKQMYLFQNSKEQKQNFDVIYCEKKVRKIDSNNVNQPAYDMISRETYQKAKQHQRKNSQQSNHFEIPISYVKRPKQNVMISTGTGGNWRNSKQQKEDSKTQDGGYYQSQFDSRVNANQAKFSKDLTCSGCGGFYCKTCGSDIPPMFRPPPGKQLHTRQIKEFLAHFNRMNDIRSKSRHQCDSFDS